MSNQPEKFRTTIGGQALIEGIYMRGPQKQAVVVRTADGLTEKVEALRLIKDRHPILGWPLIRGVVNFGSSMVCGVKALMYSASFVPEDQQEQPGKFEQWLSRRVSSETLEKLMIYFAAVVGVCFSIALFMLLPTFLVGLIGPIHDNHVLRNLLEGCVKIALLVGFHK